VRIAATIHAIGVVLDAEAGTAASGIAEAA
jgi:hypothetical protein